MQYIEVKKDGMIFCSKRFRNNRKIIGYRFGRAILEMQKDNRTTKKQARVVKTNMELGEKDGREKKMEKNGRISQN